MTWLAGPRSLEAQIVGRLNAAAAGRSSPRLVAAIPVAVCDDSGAGHEAAEVVFARYGGFENYQRQFEREGVSSAGELAVVGAEDAVEAQLRRYADVGVTELWATVFPVGPDPATSVDRTRKLLARLAPGVG